MSEQCLVTVSLLWGGVSSAFFYCQPDFVVEYVGQGKIYPRATGH